MVSARRQVALLQVTVKDSGGGPGPAKDDSEAGEEAVGNLLVAVLLW